MIPMPNLDDEYFSDINENAKSMIPQICPEWTDYNSHDAGITLIELFSWFKEMQQYYINQLSDGLKEKYLTILGMDRIGKQASTVTIEGKSKVDADLELLPYCRMFANSVCFETVKPQLILNNQIKRVTLNTKEVIHFSSEKDRLITNRMLYILPFGDSCKVGSEFKVAFENVIPYDREFTIYCSIYNDYPIKRNPIVSEREYIPIANFKVRCLTVNGWEDVQVVQDQTFAFLQNGSITLKIPRDTSKLKYDDGYTISFILTDCEYDVPPVITELKINTFDVVQKQTLVQYYDFDTIQNFELPLPRSRVVVLGSIDVYFKYGDKYIRYKKYKKVTFNDGLDCKLVFSIMLKMNFDGVRVVAYDSSIYDKKIVGTGTGFPYQEVSLDSVNIVGKDFSLMVYDRFDGVFYTWQQKENFDTSNENSREYILDEVHGKLIFGDGERGLSPDGDMVLIGYSETLAKDGNIKANVLKCSDCSNVELNSISVATGGRSAETIEECFARFNRSLEASERCITFKDFEDCVYSTQGLMVSKCRAIATEPYYDTNGVTLIVQPYSNYKRPALSDAYIKNILNAISSKRLIGTKVTVVSPQYIGIDVYAEVCTKSHYANSYDVIKQAVMELFNSSQLTLGGTISYSNVYCLLDTLECVDYVKSLSVTAKGSNYQVSDNGDITLCSSGIAYLNSAEYTIFESR